MRKIAGLLRPQQGQAVVEYAPILIFVSIVALVALRVIGNWSSGNFETVAGFFQ
ncbi:Hypothetical protein LUCI_4153 [Lucifera butyrica]|uniref:Flp/fap pilin component n=1 Tax=Lucifera butyrica TaxID=1351585 RepID=A0A498RDE8_9FIRM|nr:hypothetical protein [Lucifera butyrica]VBB08870.1 Hypothetical protein LUCI_4153 [Lucifera butyrica]